MLELWTFTWVFYEKRPFSWNQQFDLVTLEFDLLFFKNVKLRNNFWTMRSRTLMFNLDTNNCDFDLGIWGISQHGFWSLFESWQCQSQPQHSTGVNQNKFPRGGGCFIRSYCYSFGNFKSAWSWSSFTADG